MAKAKPASPSGKQPPVATGEPGAALEAAASSAIDVAEVPAIDVAEAPAIDVAEAPAIDAPEAPAIDAPAVAFPVVGIGCSAGGLEPLEKFLAAVPVKTGIAFVIVQHLAPDHDSILAELLQRATRLPVSEVTERTVVKPDCVYVIPPNKDLTILHGVLHLLDMVEPRGQRLPIDFFLRALAEDRRDKAIGVILSGMGSDGMFGVRAIKEKGGLVLVQDPTNAQAESMPRSAIDAGLADIVALPGELPGRILTFLKHPALAQPPALSDNARPKSDLEKVIVLLRERTGNDFSLYKANSLTRRIDRRIALHQIAGIAEYVRYLRNNPQELDLLFKELLIGVTNFFRDPEVWDFLRNTALPELLARYPGGKTLRAWVPACSSGEEVYTLAIVLKETQEASQPLEPFDFQLYATDLDPDAIERARKGLYPANIAGDLTPERLNRYFVEESGGFRIRKEIREMVVFATQNIASDPPFTKLDIISCRNLLIYFHQQLQNRLFPLFHYSLNRDGLLIIGSAETVGQFSNLFASLNSKARIYRRDDQTLPVSGLGIAERTSPATTEVTDAHVPLRTESVGQLTDQLIQQNFAPPAVLVNAEGDIIYISGRTGKYLEPAAGKVNINIHAMAREGLREALPGVIRKALQDARPIHLNNLQISTDGGIQVVNLTVQAIDRPEPLRGRVLFVFNPVPSPPVRRKSRKSVDSVAHEALLQELQQTRESLQVAHEEMQTSMEELKSSNEEMQSTNEELQSTNEELTTSKEELQSLNEELHTVNAELQSKVDDLTWVSNDMSNLLNSTEIATIFLDIEINLRRYTPLATNLFKMIPGDVGRPLAHIVTDLDYPQLKDDAHEVLRSLVFQERQVATRDGRWYRVRIMPYRTQDNVIDGVVITFIDINEIVRLQAQLNKVQG